MSLQLGEIESKYEILEKLGEGGMGAVFKARHRLLDEVRVIKAILPLHQGDQDLQLRFRREAQAATRLRHPNIAQVHDLLIDDEGTTHIVMEFIEGRTLQQALTASGPPDLDTAVEIATQALQAVGYLHGQGYLHRDISPDNFMLTRSFDGSVLVKLIDLGLAKRHAGSVGLTATGVFMGKVRYAAPEQFADPDCEFDPRSDLYSFGVVLYELLTGQCPIRGETFPQMIAFHLNHPVPDFEETDPGGRVPQELREATMRALEKEPEDRIPSAELLLEALVPYRAEPAGKSQYLEKLLASILPAKPRPSRSPGSSRNLIDTTVGTLVSPRKVGEPISRTDVMADPEPSGDFGGAGAAETDSVAAETGSVAAEADAVTATEVIRKFSPAAIATWALAAAGLIGALLVGMRLMNPTPPPPIDTPGSLRLDAVPWAEVREIKNRDGESQPLNGSVYTPVVLSLEPGSYQISLVHPDFSEPRSVEVEILADESVQRSVEFEVVAVESYFDTVGLTARLEEAGL